MAAICSSSCIATCQPLNLSPASSASSSASVVLFSTTHYRAQKYLFSKSSTMFVGKCSRLRSFNMNSTTHSSASCDNNGSLFTSVPTLYGILGIKQDVGLLEIKSAFRQLARQHHPDVCSSADATDQATDRFIQMKDAYHTLSDPHLKTMYDQQLRGSRFSNFSFIQNKKRTSTRCQTASSHIYQPQWEDQLSGLRHKSQRAPEYRHEQGSGGSSSWGARMRLRMQDDNSKSGNLQTAAL